MDRIQIRGGAALNGAIPISGAKNAALPLMISSLLTEQTLTLENLPRLADVGQLAHILGNHGVDYSVDGKRVGEEAGAGQTAHLRARTIVDTTAPYELVSRKCARVSGCSRLCSPAPERSARLAAGRLRDRHAAGRPVADGDRKNLAFQIWTSKRAMSSPRRRRGFIGAEIEFPKVTVGGTHIRFDGRRQLARGTSVIRNAAQRAGESRDLADCLIKMGARIKGAGTKDDRRSKASRGSTARTIA